MPKAPDALLITDKSSIRYLSNFTGSSGFILKTKTATYLFTDFRYIERAKNTIRKGIKLINSTKLWKNPKELKKNWQKILKKHRIKILGIEENDLTIARYKKFKKISQKIKLKNCSGTIESRREIKTKQEISYTKKSQQINERVFLAIKKIIQDYCANKRHGSSAFLGRPSKTKTALPSQKTDRNSCTCRNCLPFLTEISLARKIIELGHAFGADEVSFAPIIAFGKNSSMPHHEPGLTKLKKGDLVLVDMGMKYKGYCSDMTRIIFTSKPTSKQKEIYNLVLKAQEAAIKKIKAGLSGKKADAISRSIIEKAGYGEQYGHAGGHGTGLDIHEQPSLSDNYKKPLKANSIITVEPGIYLPGEFGIRIEDMLLVTRNGNRNLTKISKKI
ncbi:MAG: aminopeptidase P family protein [Candidatus Gracilibacteria bacterium]